MRGLLLVFETNCKRQLKGQLPSSSYNHNTNALHSCRTCNQVREAQMLSGFSVYCGCKMNWAAPWVALCNQSSKPLSLAATRVTTLWLKQPICFYSVYTRDYNTGLVNQHTEHVPGIGMISVGIDCTCVGSPCCHNMQVRQFVPVGDVQLRMTFTCQNNFRIVGQFLNRKLF